MYQPEAQYFLYNEFGYKTDYDKFLEYLLTFQSSLREDFFPTIPAFRISL